MAHAKFKCGMLFWCRRNSSRMPVASLDEIGDQVYVSPSFEETSLNFYKAFYTANGLQ